MDAAIYSIETGKVLRFVSAPASMIDVQVHDGEEFYLNCPQEATHIIDNEPVTVVPQPPVLTLEEVKEAKLAELASGRYLTEVSGIPVGTTVIRTDRESQAQLLSALTMLKEGFAESIPWKAERGVWIELNLEDITGLALAVSTHVQSCFAREKGLASLVTTAETKEDVEAIVWSL